MSIRFTNPFPRFFTNDAALLNGGKLNFYENDGGTTRKDTYSDVGLTTPNANPVVLTASGVVPDIFLDGPYRVVLTDSSGLQIDSAEDINTETVAEVSVDDANNNSVTNVITMTHTTTGTPAAGIGTGIAFVTETSAGNNETGMELESVATDVTVGSEDFDFRVNLVAAGSPASEVFRVASTGAVSLTGDLLFSGATDPEILGGDTDGVLTIGPSTSNALGGVIKVYGDTHATKAGDIEFYNDTTLVASYDNSAQIWDFNGTTSVDGITTSAAGITFPGSTALNSYLEGTFTFGVEDGSANAVSLSGTTGYFRKIGQLVYLSMYIEATSLGSASGAIKVTGIPFFVASSGTVQMQALQSSYAQNLNITAGYSIGAKLDAGSTEADLTIWDAAAGTTDLTAAELSADGIILLTGTYFSNP